MLFFYLFPLFRFESEEAPINGHNLKTERHWPFIGALTIKIVSHKVTIKNL